MAKQRKILTIFLVSCFLIQEIFGAPRGKNKEPKTHYDQKQTGDYNIRLNLKDFQIVAFVDDSLGDLGSYDYNYDYSELTVKPGSVSTLAPSSSTTEFNIPTHSSNKPILSSTSIKTSSETPTSSTTSKSTENASTTSTSTTTKKPEFTTKFVEISSVSASTVSVLNVESTTANPPTFIPGNPDKIPVYVQPVLTKNKDETGEKKGEITVTSVSIVPSEDVASSVNVPHNTNVAPLGEIMYYRKCASGFARDKRGRCRKIRRPQFNFGISRLASSLASKLNFDENESNSSSEIDE